MPKRKEKVIGQGHVEEIAILNRVPQANFIEKVTLD